MRLLLALSLSFSSGLLWCQPTNWGAVGVSYNPGAKPAIAGTGLYARAINAESGTYAFTVVDALPTSVKPFIVQTAFSSGFAQRVLTVRGVDVFIPASAGVSYTGSNTGWMWASGGLAAFSLKGGWKLFPTVRIGKSSIVSSYQVIGGILVGWGW